MIQHGGWGKNVFASNINVMVTFGWPFYSHSQPHKNDDHDLPSIPSISGISLMLLTWFGPIFKGKVEARSRQYQGKVKTRSRQSQCNVEARLGKGQGRVKARSRQGHGNVKASSRQGQGKFMARSRRGYGKVKARSRQGWEPRSTTVIASMNIR